MIYAPSEESVLPLVCGTLTPVSYTHLDVYKRQGYYTPFTSVQLHVYRWQEKR